MHKVIHDILVRHCTHTTEAEVELRIPVPPSVFDVMHAGFDHGRSGVYTTSELTYADHTDLRCVNGEWQRKRKIVAEPLPCIIPFKFCVSVESPARPTSLHVDWKTTERKRWTYSMGAWRVEWTKSSRACNIEIEYNGTVHALMERMDLEAHGLSAVVDAVCVHATVLAYGKVREAGVVRVAGMPFAAFSGRDHPMHFSMRKHYRALMAVQQPVSLREPLPANMEPFVSLKYDGCRMVLCTQQYRGKSVVWGLGRGHTTFSIPCESSSRNMVLDCEFMLEERRFVVFDIFELDGVACRGKPYRQRLTLLGTLPLPQLAGYTVEMKVFYPAYAVTQGWYDKINTGNSDGLIIHDKRNLIGGRCLLFKWKPKHTVDLMVNRHGYLCDGRTHEPFMRVAPDHGKKLEHAQIWECSIDADNIHIHPLHQRFDKQYSNAPHVLQEIKKAHIANYSLRDVGRMLKKIVRRDREVRRQRAEKKRKLSSI